MPRQEQISWNALNTRLRRGRSAPCRRYKAIRQLGFRLEEAGSTRHSRRQPSANIRMAGTPLRRLGRRAAIQPAHSLPACNVPRNRSSRSVPCHNDRQDRAGRGSARRDDRRARWNDGGLDRRDGRTALRPSWQPVPGTRRQRKTAPAQAKACEVPSCVYRWGQPSSSSAMMDIDCRVLSSAQPIAKPRDRANERQVRRIGPGVDEGSPISQKAGKTAYERVASICPDALQGCGSRVRADPCITKL